MALREITINGQTILVEVADLKVEGQSADNRREPTAASAEGGDMTDRIDHLLKALTAPVQAACQAAGAAEWSLRINIGFGGKAALPFIASGEANAAVRVTAKWKPAA
ncbi:CU044_2847 family protein [uncultured Thiodictyon sp.]|jgi:hypothetical protein|uniref:CU044_2847 family protein n=1 Tax=uncultured Thiodictyon sp. TaxID=1846217 RepID=UPI0025E84B81|nr:CU044_2847 family protein [uncultured Thiodictyon sp.]